MTQGWTDIANSTLVVVWGANPTENHPACMAHVNRARFPKDFFTGARANKKAAKMIVIDPRKSRTAALADAYVRIRPGTDIALINGLLNMIITKIEAGEAGKASDGVTNIADNFTAYLNQSAAGQFYTDGNATAGSLTAAGNVPAQAKYTDARFLLNEADGTAEDYLRHRIVASTGADTAIAPDSTTISDFPWKSADARVNVDVNGTVYPTVYNALKKHVAHYTADVVADICACDVTDIEMIADAMIQNSRHASYNPMAMADATNPNYRATTILYAMGITQHTCGSATIKGFSTLQSILGNMGRAGGGINALRGIHNVQGSTDMGLLYANIPGYSYNPTVQPATDANAFGKYMDSLWGNPLSGSGTRALMDQSYKDAYVPAAGNLQQRGFFNMNLKWFGDFAGLGAGGETNRAKIDAVYSLWPKGNGHNHVKMFREMIAGRTKALVAWGQNPAVTEPNQSKIREGMRLVDTLVVVDMFETETAKVDRKDGGLTFLFPACSYVEKAGSATNSGRVLQWRYQARTPAGHSKDDNELLLMFAKEFDSAYSNAFSHIKAVWESAGIFGYSAGSPVPEFGVWQKLYSDLYMGGAATFAAATMANVEMVNMRPALTSTNVDATYSTATVTGSEAVAEYIYQEFTKSVATGGGTVWLYTEGYDSANKAAAPGANNAAPRLTASSTISGVATTGYTTAWGVANRAKSRGLEDPGMLGFHKWGYSWLVNRRVFYNNSEVPFDQADFFMSPDSVSRMFAPKHMPAVTLYGTTGASSSPVFNYSRWYRTHGGATSHVLYDMPRIADGSTPAVHEYPGRFPSFVEPYETNRPDLALVYGYNSTDNDKINTVGYRNLLYDENAGGTLTGQYGLPSEGKYPLLLTTIRCVEHFQGGPITRNNSLNVELEPQPWIEINSVDARKWGIKDGDMVDVITARSNSTSDQLTRTPNYVSTGSSTDTFGQGFKARVGVGTPDSQRVAPGVVAIPWHWGDAGLSTGSRANDLCIDAIDADSTIPESKVSLCKIVRIP